MPLLAWVRWLLWLLLLLLARVRRLALLGSAVLLRGVIRVRWVLSLSMRARRWLLPIRSLRTWRAWRLLAVGTLLLVALRRLLILALLLRRILLLARWSGVGIWLVLLRPRMSLLRVTIRWLLLLLLPRWWLIVALARLLLSLIALLLLGWRTALRALPIRGLL
jgi:hypothetical protein